MLEIPETITYQNIIWNPYANTSDRILENKKLINKTKQLQESLDNAWTEMRHQNAFNKQLQQNLKNATQNLQKQQVLINSQTKNINKLQKQLKNQQNQFKDNKQDLHEQMAKNNNFQHEMHKIPELQQKLNNITNDRDQLQHQLTHKTEEFILSKNKIFELQSIVNDLNNNNKNNNNNNDNNKALKSAIYDFEYMRSYNNWIRGIGDHYLSNDIDDDITNSQCIFPSTSSKLSAEMIINTDIYHDVIKQCTKGSFTNLYDRTLIVQCSIRNKPMIAEYIDIYHSEPGDIKQFKALKNDAADQSIFIYSLKRKTQIVWIKCGNSYDMQLSLKSLRGINYELYQYKKHRIQNKFDIADKSDILPPNIVIFIIGSISRSQFIRSSPMTVNYLSDLLLNPSSRTDILEFFRYSTVGYDTRVNLAALIGGTCIADNCNQTLSSTNCVGLSQFYDRLGYYVPGFSKNNKNETGDNKENECSFYLSSNIFPENCLYHRFNMDYAAEFVLKSLGNKEQDVPYFMIIDSKINDVTHSKYSYVFDKYLRDLIENIDKTNTILHIISDHGGYNGYKARNIYGHWESNNPVSIMLLPQYLNDKEIINLNVLRRNQQRHINHYDMNLFYKELMLQFIQYKNKNDVLSKYKQLIYGNLPKHNDFVFSKSIINGVIPVNRSCDYIDKGHCFCDVMDPTQITKKLIKDNIINIKLMINTINDLTGNGEWQCDKLNANDFGISFFLFDNDNYIRLTIQQTPNSLNISVHDKSKYNRLKMEGKVLSYSGDIYINPYYIKNIIRVNSFDSENCLTMHSNQGIHDNYNGKPVFVDNDLNKKLIKMNDRKSKLYDLTLCRCKN